MPSRTTQQRGAAGVAPTVPRILLCWLALACLLLTGCHPDLFAAARQSRQQAALVEIFPDPQAQALAIAAEHGDAREVTRLMREEGVDPDAIFSSPKGRIPLLAWPIITGNPEGLRAMLEAGADPNVKRLFPSDRGERYQPNAMVWAAQQPDPIYLRILLDHGGDPDTRNANDEALLFHAYINGNQWRNVQLLVERGADVNADVSVGRTILNVYASRGAFETAYWLLERGADPSREYDEQRAPVAKADSHAIEAIFWHPGDPEAPDWQIKCQAVLLARGYERPPIPEHYRAMRERLGLAVAKND
ncbi:ankyrin repeat domain-containing protein [Luteimonas sp. SDU101]|uniref:ankyrin repeat domain-containing protein n=1 Tax=Luteimonas sp. SDU101 TaxID=3422593 RepID=UPI003EBC0937